MSAAAAATMDKAKFTSSLPPLPQIKCKGSARDLYSCKPLDDLLLCNSDDAIDSNNDMFVHATASEKMDAKKPKKTKKVKKVKFSLKSAEVETIPNKKEAVFLHIDDEDNKKEKKCYLKKSKNFDKQQVAMDFNSCNPIDDLDLLNTDEAIENFSYESSQDLEDPKYVDSTAADKMMNDSHGVDFLYEELERHREEMATLMEMLEKERTDNNGLQEMLKKERENNNGLQEMLEKEREDKAAVQEMLEKEREDKAAVQEMLEKERKDNNGLRKMQEKERDKLGEEQSRFAKIHQKVEVQLCSDKEAMKQLKKNLEQSEQKLKEKTESYHQLTQEKERKIQQLQDSIIEVQEKVLNQNSCNIQVLKLEREITAKDQRLISLNTKVNQMSTDLAEEKNKNLSLQVNITAVQSQLQKAERQITDLTHKNMERFKEIQETKLSYVSEKTAVTQLQERLENEKKDKTALMVHVQSLVDIIKTKDELLCLKDQGNKQLTSKILKRKEKATSSTSKHT
ncbi:hypothetical protein PAMP_022988 [Pampus punctatissimus]